MANGHGAHGTEEQHEPAHRRQIGHDAHHPPFAGHGHNNAGHGGGHDDHGPNAGPTNIETIVGTITDEMKKRFDSHMDTRFKQWELKHVKINDYKTTTAEHTQVPAGTNYLFNDQLKETYDQAKDQKWWGKNDVKSIADTLEHLVINSLYKLGSPVEVDKARIHEGRKKEGGFRDDRERLEKVLALAREYLGASDEDVQKIYGALMSGDDRSWHEGLNEFVDRLKDTAVATYVARDFITKVKPDEQHKYVAHLIDTRMKKMGHRFDKPLTALDDDVRIHHRIMTDHYAREQQGKIAGYKTEFAEAAPSQGHGHGGGGHGGH
jgi:hypothetical protein